mmetsp:Transcript_13573/g.34136  ORF Transcript_13573/g.34136 Transcript_13573/m.34136 type:complete len:199 (-) Transcript_13573:601-1197(-)
MYQIKASLLFAMALYGLESSYAFQIHQQVTRPTKLFVETDSFQDIDLDLAEDLANNFGKYTIDEIEQIRDELHARRVQHVALDDDVTSPDIVKERFLETELTMQLDWLNHEMPESYLFSEDGDFDSDIDTPIGIDGLLMDNGLVAVDLPPLPVTETFTEKVVDNKKSDTFDLLAGEGVLESIAICAFIGFLMMSPESF